MPQLGQELRGIPGHWAPWQAVFRFQTLLSGNILVTSFLMSLLSLWTWRRIAHWEEESRGAHLALQGCCTLGYTFPCSCLLRASTCWGTDKVLLNEGSEG